MGLVVRTAEMFSVDRWFSECHNDGVPRVNGLMEDRFRIK